MNGMPLRIAAELIGVRGLHGLYIEICKTAELYVPYIYEIPATEWILGHRQLLFTSDIQ